MLVHTFIIIVMLHESHHLYIRWLAICDWQRNGSFTECLTWLPTLRWLHNHKMEETNWLLKEIWQSRHLSLAVAGSAICLQTPVLHNTCTNLTPDGDVVVVKMMNGITHGTKVCQNVVCWPAACGIHSVSYFPAHCAFPGNLYLVFGLLVNHRLKLGLRVPKEMRRIAFFSSFVML